MPPRATTPSRPRPFVILGNIVSVVGTLVFVASIVAMSYLWVSLVVGWLGTPGIFVGLVTAPLGALYPFIHWAAVGTFPQIPFLVWIVGIAGMVASMGWAYAGRERAEARE